MEEEKDEKILWENNIKKYDLKWPDENIIRYLNISYPKVENRSREKVLDFGCGSGRNTAAIAQLGFETYAVDCNDQCIMKTREMLKNTVGDIFYDFCRRNKNTDIPFELDFFDCIIGWGCMYLSNSNERKSILKEMYNKLKPGGLLYANWRSTDDYFMGKGKAVGNNEYKLDSRVNAYGMEGMTFYFAEKELLEALYDECGFEIYNVEKKEFTIKNMTVNNSYWHIWARKKDK